MARKRVRELRQKRRDFTEKYGVFVKNTAEARRNRAARLIGLRWREYAMKKEKRLQEREH